MSKKKNLGDDFSFPKLDDFKFPKNQGINGIKSPKRKLLPKPPLPDIKVPKPLLPNID